MTNAHRIAVAARATLQAAGRLAEAGLHDNAAVLRANAATLYWQAEDAAFKHGTQQARI